MSFKKLNHIQNGDIRLTAGYHGGLQGGRALDFDSRADLVAPTRCRLIRKAPNPADRYASFCDIEILDTIGRVFYQIVHFETDKPEGYIFKEGEVLGFCTANFHPNPAKHNHYHIALNVVGKWESVMDFTKRDRKIVLVGKWTNPYDQWSFYGDRSIQFKSAEKPKPTPTPPKPKPPAPKPQRTWKIQGNRQLWRSEAIQQIINAGLLKGTWQQYDQEFNRLNPIPTGGYRPGQIVKIPNV